MGEEEHNDDTPHGTNILLKVDLPFVNTNRVVCADSYFTSVFIAELIHTNVLKFIGAVKTWTKKYPLTYLGAIELESQGDRFGLIREK